MNTFAKRLKKSIGLDLSTAAVLGGVALATTFAAAQALNLFALETQHVAVYGSMPRIETFKPAASESSSSSSKKKIDRAALRKAAKEKRALLRRQR